VIAVALLALATGFCLFDQHDDHNAGHAAALDLCLSMLAVSLAAIPSVRFSITGSTVNVAVATAYIVARRIPDPPPRPALFY
jgi:hypothetical protein